MANSQSVQVPGENLIPVFTAEIGGVSTLAVNARDLHGFLGVKRDFSAWIKERLAESKFVEGEDFRLTQMGKAFDYIFELSAAKELAMREEDAEGQMARKYFVECELRLGEARRVTEEDPDQSATEIPDSRETERERLLNEAIQDRILFWALRGLDGICHPGMDRRVLFSVAGCVFAALADELHDEAMRKVSSTPTSTHGLIKFINEWVPAFFREGQNVA
ncbi:MAG: antA/AntB antirepressor family protein [Methylococcales bacterium]|nr:antA/AntB antirepressor family protein [Methylococcales bacterium]